MRNAVGGAITPSLPQATQGAVLAYQQGNWAEAERLCRSILATTPRYFDALHLLGIIAAQTQRAQEAVELFSRACAVNPNHARIHNNLGNALRELMRHTAAVESYEQAIALQPDYAEAYNNRGSALAELTRHAAALESYERAIALRPDYAEAYFNRGNALADLKHHEAALQSYERAIALKPGYAEAYHNHGGALAELAHHEAALESFERAIALKPDYAEAYNDRGGALAELTRYDDALASYAKAIALKPDYAEAYYNRGVVLAVLTHHDAALENYARAIALKPDYTEAHSNLLFCLHFVSDLPVENILAESRRWNEVHAAPLMSTVPAHANTRDPTRRLRIGYLSPDLRRHAVAYFIEPVLANHDKQQFEIFVYYNNALRDDFTNRLAGHVDRWLDCNDMSDQQLAQRIRADGIDILVDLAGHTARNRLLTFARKPAPIQITYLGYPGTSGLSAMDYRLTDNYADPPGSEANYTERLLRLPDSLWCYRPGSDTPEIASLPALRNGYITFGSFNNFNKVSIRCIELWARVLLAAPGSHLLMVTVPEGASRLRLTEQFGALGVAASRLEFCGKLAGAEFLRMFQRVDVTLDPVTVNGATTTCESLWMGVPTLSLSGNRFLSRAGLSILSAAGLKEFVAKSPEDYVRIAANLASDLPRLAALRAGMRTRVARSPLVDEALFTRNIEDRYREVWTQWCNSSV